MTFDLVTFRLIKSNELFSGKRLRFQVRISSMDEYDVIRLIQETLVVFVASTTGQGEVPDSMKSFWKFLLRRNLPSTSLTTMRFSVAGLGDSSYSKFNFAAKRLHKRLVQLGATPLGAPTLGDDQHDHGPDAAIDPWLADFWDKALVGLTYWLLIATYWLLKN